MVTPIKPVPLEGDVPFDLGPEYEAELEAALERRRANAAPIKPDTLPDW
jgi:hypothetical protein